MADAQDLLINISILSDSRFFSAKSDVASELGRLSMFDGEQFVERLRSVVNGENVEMLSAKSGVAASTIRNYLKGTVPGIDKIVQLAQASGTSIRWLATGEGPRDLALEMGQSAGTQPEQGAGPMLQIVDREQLDDSALVLLPRLDVEAAAGAGAVVASEYVAEMLAFSAAWLRERHITPRSARILTARGDSMEPTIRDGDLLIVDTAIEMAVDNGIYCLAYNGVLLVKRLIMTRAGGLIISSDNKLTSRDEEIPPHEVPEVHIKGRVMWYGRTI